MKRGHSEIAPNTESTSMKSNKSQFILQNK